MSSLLVCSPDGTVWRRVTLDPVRAYAIGRSRRCDIALSIASVSRRHALLFCHAGEWQIIDTGSRRGLVVDGHEVRRVALSTKVGVEVGPIVLRLGDGGHGDAHFSGQVRLNNGHGNTSVGHPDANHWNARTLEMPAFDGLGTPLANGSSVDPIAELLLVQSASGIEGVFNLRSVDHATIGFDPLCHISLPARAGLAALHAVAFREPKAWVLMDAGGGIVSLGDRFLRRRLGGAITAELGEFRLRILEPTVIEPRRGDLAPRAVSAFLPDNFGVQLAADDADVRAD